MGRPLVSLGCSMVLVCMAVVSPVPAAEAGPYAQPTHPGHSVAAVNEMGTTANGYAQVSPPINADSVLLHVDVYENGTAQWRIEYRTRIDDRTDRAAFRRLQRYIRENPEAASAEFYERIRASISAAENATGREMAGTEFDVNASVRRIPQEYGVVTYSFRWQGFATVSDRRISVGDALAGFFLNDNERLLLSWPRGYELVDVRPEPDARRDRTVVWSGPTEFGPEEPRLTLADRPGPWTQFIPVGTAVIIVTLAAALVWARHNGHTIRPPVSGLFSDDGPESQLLSNEEKVLRLIEEHGGRVKQQDVADELGWTRTKTSYVVSNLREDDRIRSFRLGRENVLSLPESQDSDTRSE